jgi:hypothetical protein
VQKLMLVGRIAQLVDHRLRDHGARRNHETRALDRIDFARRIVDLGAERVRERIVERKARPGGDVHLLILRIHGVFGERLQMLPAAQGAEPADVQRVHREMRAVAFAEHRALGMRRLELATLGDGFAVRADDPLGDVETAAVAFRKAKRHDHLVALGGGAQPLRLLAVVLQRVVEIT